MYYDEDLYYSVNKVFCGRDTLYRDDCIKIQGMNGTDYQFRAGWFLMKNNLTLGRQNRYFKPEHLYNTKIILLVITAIIFVLGGFFFKNKKYLKVPIAFMGLISIGFFVFESLYRYRDAFTNNDKCIEEVKQFTKLTHNSYGKIFLADYPNITFNRSEFEGDIQCFENYGSMSNLHPNQNYYRYLPYVSFLVAFITIMLLSIIIFDCENQYQK